MCRFSSLDCGIGKGTQRITKGTGQTQLPPGWVQDVVVSGLKIPTAFAFLPDGRILVAEKPGIVRLVEDGQVLPTPFLDISDRVNTYANRGLLAIEPHPDFETNGWVYAYYVREDGTGDTKGPRTVRVSRFTAAGDTASADTEEVILGADGKGSCNDLPDGSDCIPSDGDHSGGDIVFASDGTMFVTTGDGWFGEQGFSPNSLRSQNLDSLGGKLLRVTPDGQGLESNPFWSGSPDDNRSKVYAYGLRNPWRLSLRPGTDVPYIGDVGWDEREEIDVGKPGRNYGWPCWEGDVQPPEYSTHAVCQELYAQGPEAVEPPISVHTHPGANTIIGGSFATSETYPEDFRNTYFYADWGKNWFRHLAVDDENRPVPGTDVEFGSELAGPVSIETGPDGLVYYLAINAGEIRRLRYEAP